jgi:hydrogen peroxide-dependent heme synthase
MTPENPSRAHPPETLEGWYALHQVFSSPPSEDVDVGRIHERSLEVLERPAVGWSSTARLIGSKADILAVHFRPTLEELATVQDGMRQVACTLDLTLTYSFLSVTEAGLYHLTAQLARDAAARGGSVGDQAYAADLAQRAAAERENPHVQRRLYPQLPADMPYVCFYPMSKRREPGQNWYQLSLDERSRLMHTHGLTGRRYAGRVLQIITGAIGFDAWEWGVTLFAKDPLDFKKLVTDMRFDEVSANYAEFGEFFVGKLV